MFSPSQQAHLSEILRTFWFLSLPLLFCHINVSPESLLLSCVSFVYLLLFLLCVLAFCFFSFFLDFSTFDLLGPP